MILERQQDRLEEAVKNVNYFFFFIKINIYIKISTKF